MREELEQIRKSQKQDEQDIAKATHKLYDTGEMSLREISDEIGKIVHGSDLG